jgi:hypothetical protein
VTGSKGGKEIFIDFMRKQGWDIYWKNSTAIVTVVIDGDIQKGEP